MYVLDDVNDEDVVACTGIGGGGGPVNVFLSDFWILFNAIGVQAAGTLMYQRLTGGQQL